MSEDKDRDGTMNLPDTYPCSRCGSIQHSSKYHPTIPYGKGEDYNVYQSANSKWVEEQRSLIPDLSTNAERAARLQREESEVKDNPRNTLPERFPSWLDLWLHIDQQMVSSGRSSDDHTEIKLQHRGPSAPEITTYTFDRDFIKGKALDEVIAHFPITKHESVRHIKALSHGYGKLFGAPYPASPNIIDLLKKLGI